MSYTAIVLTDESHNKLISYFEHMWSDDSTWKTFAHHSTLHMGRATEEERLVLGEFVTLVADAFAENEFVKAVRVSLPPGVKTKNDVPHITLAVNKQNGGKPVMSNHLKNWKSINPIRLRGRIEEVS